MAAFQELKSAMMSPTVLALPDFSKPFIIESDASCTVKKWQSYLHGNHFIIRTDYHSLKYFLQNRANSPFQQKWVSKLLGFDYEIQYKKGNDNKAANALSRMFSNSRIPLDTTSTTLDVSAMNSIAPNSVLPGVLGSELTAISYPYMSWLDDLRRHVEQDD
ncbi:hypothetical protein COP2_035883 [Malus domestica]